MAEEKKDLSQEELKKESCEEVNDNPEAKAECEDKEPSEGDKKDKKKNKGDKKVEELKEKIKDLEDKNIRQIAEFQNFRNRTEKEKSQMFDMGAKNVIEKILPVVDNFERGLASVPADEAEDGFYNGMNMIYKQLLGELDKIGVKPIEAKGKEFDPNLHNAVMQVQSDELESGTVAEELQKGYTYHDSVVRHAMVSVVE